MRQKLENLLLEQFPSAINQLKVKYEFAVFPLCFVTLNRAQFICLQSL